MMPTRRIAMSLMRCSLQIDVSRFSRCVASCHAVDTPSSSCRIVESCQSGRGSAHQLFRSVDALLRPKVIAIVGATDTGGDGWSKAIYDNLGYCGFPAR